MKARVFVCVVWIASCFAPALADPRRVDFVDQLVAEHGWTASEVEAVLGEARYQQNIIDAISRPAEAKPWHAYRPIFITQARIDGGVEFYRQHAELLEAQAAHAGVEAEILVAIIGVETNYGRITGRYRVLDALYTLGFHYPPRQDFFLRELQQMFLLSREQNLDITEVTGSYAGAMGWGQFIPSSYRAYAVDGDDSGQIDLWNSRADLFASVANYFKVHGWQQGAPVAVPARMDPGARELGKLSLEAVYPLSQLAEWGYHPVQDGFTSDLPATLLTLEGADGPELWITFNNFYVISRYNRSALYSMVVHQLSREIAAGIDAD